MALDDRILEQASAWAVRTGDPGFEDWDSFTLWLEDDPAHAAAYDLVVMETADAAAVLPPLPLAENDDDGASYTRRRWAGGLLAIVLVLFGGLGLWQMRGGTYEVQTAPGETRIIQLAGGGNITLGGGTRLTLYRRDDARAVLEEGQALFTIRHDDERPFRVAVGDDELIDIGTVFDVRFSAGLTSVAVSEGAVLFNPSRQNVRIDPGHVLTSEQGSAAYSLVALPVEQIGEWRDGRLTFRDTTLDVVAADLTRATGMSFAVAPGAAQRRVSGSLLAEPVRSDPRSIGPLLGVAIRPADEGLVIEAR